MYVVTSTYEHALQINDVQIVATSTRRLTQLKNLCDIVVSSVLIHLEIVLYVVPECMLF